MITLDNSQGYHIFTQSSGLHYMPRHKIVLTGKMNFLFLRGWIIQAFRSCRACNLFGNGFWQMLRLWDITVDSLESDMGSPNYLGQVKADWQRKRVLVFVCWAIYYVSECNPIVVISTIHHWHWPPRARLGNYREHDMWHSEISRFLSLCKLFIVIKLPPLWCWNASVTV